MMPSTAVMTNEAVIAMALGCQPEREIELAGSGWRFSRWRQPVGSYELGALPEPLFVVHIGSKAYTRLREGEQWSATKSGPGCATIVPAGCDTRWRVDGELDVVTVSMPCGVTRVDTGQRVMRFAFPDELGVALTRRILGELYKPETRERGRYIQVLAAALQAHLAQSTFGATPLDFPISGNSGYRIHRAIDDILARPEAAHCVDGMAETAGLTSSHFSHVFKETTGLSPYQFVIATRLDRARQMLARSDLLISQIADSLGFTSQSHFTRAFRKYSGQTPTAWRTGATENAGSRDDAVGLMQTRFHTMQSGL